LGDLFREGAPSRQKIVYQADRSFGHFAGGQFSDLLGEAVAANYAANYNDPVARGWESKSVEEQQAEANDKSAKLRPAMSADKAARWREKESLRLARQRVLQQLEASQNPRHRKLLEDALADLDEKLGK